MNEELLNLIEKKKNHKIGISYLELNKMLNENINIYLIDVRSKQEYLESHLNGAINIPVYEIDRNISKYISSKEEKIVCYCQQEKRSRNAVKILKKLGYKKIYFLNGGLDNI